MKDDYSYLKDPRALAEIRKHKWIESQKHKTEIGFATAALDWIKRYGRKWQEHHDAADNDIFIERRKYRRFDFESNVKAAKDHLEFIAESVNISFFGILLKTAQFLSLGSYLRIAAVTNGCSQDNLDCSGTVSRVINKNDTYEVFVKFDNGCRQSIHKWGFIKNK
ncbi:MAG: PilZ domain-containing protein [Candidatus Omnitrophica bacterium]|nr:PilZ domain-containing protein [Candidatus Omnitrophota bacterium]